MAWYSQFSIFGGATAGLLLGLKIFLVIILPTIICIIIGFAFYRYKYTYKYNIRFFKVRANGQVQESNFKGGFISRKNSGYFFRIKIGKMWWQNIDLILTPTIDYMDHYKNRLYYLQRDVDTFVQLRKEINLQDLDKGIVFVPLDTDTNYSAVLKIQRIKDVLSIEPTWHKILPYVGLAIVFIIAVIAYTSVLKSCSV